MPEQLPLRGETVIFTGTPKSVDVFDLVRQYGGEPYSFPLIQVGEIEDSSDEEQIKKSSVYDWLIFTSQSAVHSFQSKMMRYQLTAADIPSKIAAVGTQTAAALEEIGFRVQFIPTVFSADVFVQQFKPEGATKLHVLFLRGTLAGSLIREELPFDVDEWTVYETVAKPESVISIVDLLTKRTDCTVLFASPSAVQVFEESAVPIVGWSGFTIGAIGHVTANALKKAGATVSVTPDTYTLKELVNALARRKEDIQ